MITSYLDKQCIFLTLINVAGKSAHNGAKKKRKNDGKIMDSLSVAVYHNTSYRMRFVCVGIFGARLNRRL